MRILNVTESYAPFEEFGGPPVKVRALSEGLAGRGNQVTVVTADWGFEKRMKGSPELRGAVRSPFGWRHESNGVQAFYIPTWAHYRAVSWNPAIKRYCRARLQNYDVAHIYGLYDLLGPAVAAECRKRNIPYVVEPIGMFVPIVRNFLLKRMYHALIGRELLAEAAALIATSEQEVEELSAGGVAREKIVLRRNGVEVPKQWPERGAFRRANGISPEAKLVLFLGRLSSKKSPELLLQAFRELPAEIEGKKIQLVFAGPDESGQRGVLEKMAVQSGVAERIMFSGPLFKEEKWAAYRDADVFVLPSQNENFGNTAAEAIAAGTPVIVTENCGIAPILKDSAGLVVRHESGAISNALLRLLSDSELHGLLSAGCKEVTSRLGWKEPVEMMEALYRRVTSGQETTSAARKGASA